MSHFHFVNTQGLLFPLLPYVLCILTKDIRRKVFNQSDGWNMNVCQAYPMHIVNVMLYRDTRTQLLLS